MASVDDVIRWHKQNERAWEGRFGGDINALRHRSFAAALSAMQEENARLREALGVIAGAIDGFAGYDLHETAMQIALERSTGPEDMDDEPTAGDYVNALIWIARRALSIQDSPEGQEGK